MNISIDRCKKVKYDTVESAVKDLNLGKEFFTRKSNKTLIKIDTAELIKRYFYDLYCYPTFPTYM